jgi:hypothetical protein
MVFTDVESHFYQDHHKKPSLCQLLTAIMYVRTLQGKWWRSAVARMKLAYSPAEIVISVV